MSSELFYSEIESQVPAEMMFGKFIRTLDGSGIIEKISVADNGSPSDGVKIFSFADIFGDGHNRISYVGEPVGLALCSDRQLISDISFRFDLREDDSEKKFVPKSKSRTNITAENEAEFRNLLASSSVMEETWTSTISSISCKETEGAAAYFSADNLTVFTPLKNTQNISDSIQKITGVEKDKINFVKTVSHDKNTNSIYYCELSAVLAAFAAMKTEKAVMISMSREEQEQFVENTLTVKTKIKTVFNEENSMLAAEIKVSAYMGSFCAFSDKFIEEALKKSLGLYSPKLYSVSAEACFSDSCPKAIDFSMLDAQLFFGIECQMNKTADIVGCSPKTLKLSNIFLDSAEKNNLSISKDKITEGMRKICGILDECVKIKIEEFEENDLTKCEEMIVSDFDFSPSVFDRKWSSYRLTNKKKSLLYKDSNLRGTGLSFCFKESNSENFSGTAFAFCTIEVEINPLTYKEEITEIRLFVNGGKLLNQELAVSTVKATVQRMVKIMMNDSHANCENITIRFLKSNEEAKKIGDLVHSVLPAAFVSALSQALDFTLTDFPIGRGKIFEVLEEK